MTDIDAIQHCKLPQFWKAHPELWFTQAESTFLVYRIRSDESKYHLLISALSPDILVEVADVLKNPPPSDKYTHLKTQILDRFADSSDRQLQKLINELELGDKKPSQLLRQIRSLAHDKLSEDALRIKWLALLPSNVQRVLKIFKATNLDELATAADQLMEAPASPSILEVTQQQLPQPSVSNNVAASVAFATELPRISLALSQFIALNREMLDILMKQNSRAPWTSSQGPQQRTGRSTSPRRGRRVCRYHYKFGAAALNCLPPCDFKPAQPPAHQQPPTGN